MLINFLIVDLPSPHKLMKLHNMQLGILKKYHLNGEKWYLGKYPQILLETPNEENQHVGWTKKEAAKTFIWITLDKMKILLTCESRPQFSHFLMILYWQKWPKHNYLWATRSKQSQGNYWFCPLIPHRRCQCFLQGGNNDQLRLRKPALTSPDISLTKVCKGQFMWFSAACHVSLVF